MLKILIPAKSKFRFQYESVSRKRKPKRGGFFVQSPNFSLFFRRRSAAKTRSSVDSERRPELADPNSNDELPPDFSLFSFFPL